MLRIIHITLIAVFCFLHTADAQIKMTGLAASVSGRRPMVKVVSFTGDVEILKKETDQWVKAYSNMTLNQDDQIKTGTGAQIQIDFNGVDALIVEAESEITLKEIVVDDPKKEPVTIYQSKGKILFFAQKLIGRPDAKLISATSVTTIHGTTCGQEMQADGSAKVAVLKGIVTVENPAFKGRGQSIKAGQFTHIRQNQVPLIPRNIPVQELNVWDNLAQKRHKNAGGHASVSTATPQKTAGATTPPTTPSPAEPGNAEATPTAQQSRTTQDASAASPTASASSHKAAADAEEDPQENNDADNEEFSMSGAAGSYTNAEGQQITYISLRPEIPIWKFGIALDLELGFIIDDNGQMIFNNSDWDEAGDYLEKIYYIRYGHKKEPFYIKVGALPSASLGYGLVMNGYSNTIEYPDNKRIGVETELNLGKFGFQGVLNSVRELGNTHSGGVIGVRTSYKPIPFLEFGVTYATDRNQYANLKDTDGDGVPNYVDKFPEEKEHWLDTDNDGIPDGNDRDRDGNDRQELDSLNATDRAILDRLGIGYELADTTKQDPEPFNLDDVDDDERSFHEVAFDIGIPIITTKFINLVLYAQAAKILEAGRGFTIPGVKLNVGPINTLVEYRIFEDQFWGSYFDQIYEFNRVTIEAIGDTAQSPITKEQLLMQAQAVKGIYGALSLNVFGFLTVAATYEDLKSETAYTDRTLYGEVELNPELIPKLSKAMAYYKLAHVENFDTWKQPGALFGYKLGYELSPSSSLVFSYQETYLNLDGDSKVSDDEIDRRTSIETVFNF